MPSDLNLGVVFAAVRLRNEFTPEMQKVVAAAQKAGQEMQAAGRVLTLGLTAPLVGVAAASLKASIDFESSFAGVRKTVTATEPELQALSDGFRAMALEIPTSVNELNKIGEAAGQLGIQTPNILEFTETMAALGETTNLSSDAAATALARLANITGLQQDEFDELGSTIVALGNNFATTESEIVDFGLRIAGAGELAGLTEGDILGIGTAMSSIGVQAEAGGTAVQKVLNKMNASVASGSEELDTFAAVAGMTAEQFAQAFKEDAAGAFESFVTGLGKQGDQSFTVMEDLGLQSERVIRAFLGLANSGDLLSDSMELGNQAFEENTALMEEVEQRYGTTESQLKTLWNRVVELAITLGDELVPALVSLVDLAEPVLTFAADAVKWWSKWPGILKGASLAALALLAAIGPALLIGGTLLSSWATLTLAFPALAGALGTVGAAAKIMWIALTGPIGLFITGLVLVGAALYTFRDQLGLVGAAAAESIGDAEARVRSLAEKAANASGHMRRNLEQDLAAARAELGDLQTAEQDAGWAAFVASQQVRVLAETVDGAGETAIEVSEEIEALDWSFDKLKSGSINSRNAMMGFIGTLEPLPELGIESAMAISKLNASFDQFTRGSTESQNSLMSFIGTLQPVDDELESVKTTAGDLDVTLAAVSGQIGGASGQAINLFTSMRQSNAALKEGEKGFGKARQGAALFSGAMKDLAKQVGGTAGEILNAASNIASAFATGGPVAGAIAAVSEGIKGLFSLFGVSGLEQAGRKAAEAARDAIADTLNDGQMAEAAGNAGNAVHIAIRDAMIASGNSIAVAEAGATSLTRALWMAEKKGGPAVAAVRDRILGIVGASAEAAAAAAELADTIESLGDELAQLDRNIRLREIEANIEALEAELEAELEIIDARIVAYEDLHQTVIENIDKEIVATEEANVAALAAIDLQIAGVKELTAARLADVEFQLAAAQADVVDVSSTKGIADRLKIDLSNATVFGAQEASERITALAEDIATLQKAGVSVSAGLSEEFDTELRAAVSSVNRFGVTVPESLQTIVSTFPDIELSAINFGDGLTEAARRVKELEEARDAIQLEANERLAELALERQGIEEEFDEELRVLAEYRQEVEDEFNHGIEGLMEERQGIEDLFAGAIAVLTIERETIEDSMIESIDDMRIRRVEVEGELNAAISLAASNVAAAAVMRAPAPQPYYDDDDDDDENETEFRGGTRGRYIDFGRSSTIKVHGKERIVTESEGRREAETNAASLRGVEDRLDRLDTNLQRAIKRISTDVTNVVMTKSL